PAARSGSSRRVAERGGGANGGPPAPPRAIDSATARPGPKVGRGLEERMDRKPDDPTEQQERATLVQLGGCVGCGGLVLLVFALLALTVSRSDRRFTDEPVEVEATLQGIVP